MTAPVWAEAYSALRSATEVAQGVAELRSGGSKDMRGGMVWAAELMVAVPAGRV